MDREKLEKLEIEETELEAIEDALEEKQNDLETRIDAAESNGNMERKKQLESELSDVEELLGQVREKIKAEGSDQKAQPQEKAETVHGAVPTAVDDAVSHTVPTAMGAMDELADNLAEKVEEFKKSFGAQKSEMSEAAKEKAEIKAREAEDKKHGAELKAKAAELRKKAAEAEAAKAKEEKETAREIEKEVEKARDGAGSDANLSEYEKTFNEGITDYSTGKHTDAFQKIYKVANAGESSRLSKDKLGQAEQLLARMYMNGEGTAADEKRAWFWFEKAANHENLEGCLALAQRNTELVPKSPEEEYTYRKNALKYFGIAGNQGSKTGKLKFVDICVMKKAQISSADIKTACRFLDELIALEEDSFVKQSLADKKKELRATAAEKKEKGDIGGRPGKKMYKDGRDILAIVGAILAMFGAMYMCHYLLNRIDTSLNFEWMIPEYFLTWPPYFDGPIFGYFEVLGAADLLNIGNAADIWGLIFLFVGYLLTALSRVENRGIIANVICEVSLYSSAALGVIAFYMGRDYHGLRELIYMVCFILISRVPGMIIRVFVEG